MSASKRAQHAVNARTGLAANDIYTSVKSFESRTQSATAVNLQQTMFTAEVTPLVMQPAVAG